MATFVKVLGYNATSRNYNNLSCDSNGVLSVNVLSGGGGGGAGDASAANQLTQIQIAEDSNVAIYGQLEVQTDRLLYDLDIIANRLHDISGTVEVSNQITGFATSQLQESSNIAQWTKLNLIEQGTEISSGYLQSIDTLLTPLQQGIAKYTLDATTTLAPDTVPSYTAPPSGVAASEGWYYKNLALGNASQLYYYANQASQTKNFDYEIASVQSQWAVVRILSLNSATGLPFLVVYSQPEGAGDNIPGFARSSWVYQISSSAELRLGEKIVIYRGTQPDLRVFPEFRRVECVLSITRGPALTTEKLAYATVNTDSGAAVGNAEYIISGAGLTFAGDHVYKVELTAESAAVAGGDASSSNQLLQLTEQQNSNLAVCTRLDDSNVTIAQCLSQLEVLNVSVDAVKDGTSQFWVHTTAADDSIEIHGYNPVLAMPEVIHTIDNAAKVYVNNLTKCDTDAVTISSGSVSVSGDVGLVAGTQVNLLDSTVGLVVGTTVGISGDVAVISGATALSVTETTPITGFSLETTQADIKTQTDKLTFLDVDADLNNLKVIDSALNTQLSQFSFFTNEDTITDLRVKQMGSVDVRNPTGETLSVSGSVGIIADQSVAISGSVQTHCFASQNGSDWHHLASDSVGRLNVNARCHDALGNDITSTAVSGTETYRGLDVVCKGAVSVQNVSTTQLAVKAQQYGSYGNMCNNVASILPSGVTAGIDVSAWSYFVGSYEDYNGATVGDIRLEYSFDNTTYYTLFNTQIFPSGSGPRRANINKQDIPAVNYIRLRNGTSSTLASVTLTLLGGSLS